MRRWAGRHEKDRNGESCNPCGRCPYRRSRIEIDEASGKNVVKARRGNALRERPSGVRAPAQVGAGES